MGPSAAALSPTGGHAVRWQGLSLQCARTHGAWFTPDTTGAATFPYVVPNATRPYGFEFDIWQDTNHDGVHQTGEGTGTIATGFINITQPCSAP